MITVYIVIKSESGLFVTDKVKFFLGISYVIVSFSQKIFHELRNLSGVRIFVSTWDGYLAKPHKIADKKDDWQLLNDYQSAITKKNSFGFTFFIKLRIYSFWFQF